MLQMYQVSQDLRGIRAVALVCRADRDNLQSMPSELCCCSLIIQLWMGFRTTQVGKLSMVCMVHW